MDAIEALKTRRSVRRYEAKPVAREALEDIVDCGHLAATARGEEPWE
jgi:nitroreductase